MSEVERPQSVRLVIWDLDDTFWQGTLTEGGIAYSQQCHDVVVTLAQRGIVSSICSNNQRAKAAAILRDKGIRDYFVFADIGWGPKGQRIAALIEDVQLRPETILFIDDNPMNRAEAAFYVPGLQIADASFVADMLADPRFAGKDDRGLSRLRQYQLLDRRRSDARAAGADNLAFLRSSGIRVTIDHDVESRLDRAIELINRTNQLNFTKRRLPEDPESARRELRRALSRFDVFAGLVRVSDRYGDYGDVGFFLSHGGAKDHQLRHFCFSCRILNMGVESWVYRRLGRPQLTVRGNVVANPVGDDRELDWISEGHEAAPAASTGAPKPLRRIVLRGGCDVSAISHYLTDLADELEVELYITRDDREIRTDTSAFLRLALDGVSPEAEASLVELGYRPEDWTTSLTRPGGEGAARQIWLLSFWVDSWTMLYRHKRLGTVVPFRLPHDANAAVDITRLDAAYVSRLATTPQQKAAVEALRRDYVAVGTSDKKFMSDVLRLLMKRAPAGTLICVLLAPEKWTDSADGDTKPLPEQVRVNSWIREELSGRRNVVLFEPFAIAGEDWSNADALHFDRLFYQRAAQAIRSTALEFAQISDLNKGFASQRSARRRPWRQHVAAILDRMTTAVRARS